MLLFVYNGSREIFGNAQKDLYFVTVENTTQSAFVTIFLRQ